MEPATVFLSPGAGFRSNGVRSKVARQSCRLCRREMRCDSRINWLDGEAWSKMSEGERSGEYRLRW